MFDYGELRSTASAWPTSSWNWSRARRCPPCSSASGRLDPARTLDVLRQTAAALAAAHAAGVVHRDVKPGNVLVGNDGTVKITDFGIAWSASSVPLTGTGQVVGTAHYLSPEQAEGAKASPSSDVYALGMVAYECLAGRRAFDGENSVQIALKQIREQPDPLPDDVPPPIRAVVERAMAKDPAHRYPDGAALRDAVEAAATWSPTVPVAGVGATGTEVLALPSAGTGLSARVADGPPCAGGSARRRGGDRGSGRRARRWRGSGSGVRQHAGPPARRRPHRRRRRRSVVTAAELVGRPLAEVQAELTARGLQVEVAQVETADVTAGLVTAVTPDGELAPGTTVTVRSRRPRPPPPPRSHRLRLRSSFRRRRLLRPCPGSGARQHRDRQRARQREGERPQQEQRQRERQALSSQLAVHDRAMGRPTVSAARTAGSREP